MGVHLCGTTEDEVKDKQVKAKRMNGNLNKGESITWGDKGFRPVPKRTNKTGAAGEKLTGKRRRVRGKTVGREVRRGVNMRIASAIPDRYNPGSICSHVP